MLTPTARGMGAAAGGDATHTAACGLAAARLRESALMHATLLANGGDGEGEVPAAFVEASIQEVVMHEVGHALGLRHNFKGSTAYSWEQLADPPSPTPMALPRR